MNYQTSYTNDVAEKLFTKTQFTQEHVPEFGQIKIGLYKKLFNSKETNLAESYKWENPSKLLNIQTVNDQVLTESKDCSRYLEMILDFISGETEDIRRIEFYTSTIPMNLTPGSKSSLEFLQSMKNADNVEIFRTCVASFIDYKWE